jgi:Uma2 family endonuclease
MEQVRQQRLTAEEFIAWAIEQPSGRYELVGGTVHAMAPERVNHARAKGDAAMALQAAIEGSGLPCEAFIAGIALLVNEQTVYEPDVMVRCGPCLPGNAVKVTDPVIVVEVISPWSRGLDTGVKLEGYLVVPSVRHCLVVNTESRTVIHYHRDEEGAIGLRLLRDGILALDPPGIEIEVRELFASIPEAD